MTRNELIMAIEKRIGILLDIIKTTKTLTDEGLPSFDNSIAHLELKLLKDTSTKLQGMF